MKKYQFFILLLKREIKKWRVREDLNFRENFRPPTVLAGPPLRPLEYLPNAK